MKAALKRGVETGVLVQVKNSYKVSPEEKKKKASAAKPKKAAAKKTTKKTTAKKKVSLSPCECHIVN